MKKVLPALVFVLVLGTGGAAVYLFQKQRAGGGSATVAGEYLPADTQLLLLLPDLDGTLSDWQTTDLYKIWAEPEVQAFLAKPLSKLPPHPVVDDTFSRIAHLSISNAFIAVTALDEKTNRPRVVAGFDFKGDKSEVEQLLASQKDAMRKQYPTGKADLVEYQGHALETFDDGSGNTIASTYLEHRYLLANDLALLKDTVDRYDARVPAAGPTATLDKSPDFKSVLAKLPARYETLAFIRPQAGFQRLLDLLTATGQPLDPARRAELEKLQAIGATTAIEAGKLRDTVYCLAPGRHLDLAKLRLSSLALTSPSTLLYAAAMFDLPAKFDLPPGPPPPGTPASGLLTGLAEFGGMLQTRGLTLERFRAAFGHEVSLQLDWPADRAQPALLAAVDVVDPAAAGKFIDDLTNTPIADGAWQTSQVNGAALHTFSSASLNYVSPALTLTDKHLIFGLDPEELTRALTREQAGKSNFTSGEAYRGARAMVADPNAAFVYIDSAALFDRVYSTVRGVALLGAALLYPQVTEYVDLSKLPSAQSISRHLSPTVFSQRSDEQGSLLESVGSFTVGQAALVAVAGASAASIPIIQSQLGAQGGTAVPPGRRFVLPPSPTAQPTPQTH